MIRRWLRRLFRAPEPVRRDANVLVTMHGAQAAWLEARDRRACTTGDQQDGEARRREARHWNAVMREIERQTGYRHQPDPATRHLDR